MAPVAPSSDAYDDSVSSKRWLKVYLLSYVHAPARQGR